MAFHWTILLLAILLFGFWSIPSSHPGLLNSDVSHFRNLRLTSIRFQITTVKIYLYTEWRRKIFASCLYTPVKFTIWKFLCESLYPIVRCRTSLMFKCINKHSRECSGNPVPNKLGSKPHFFRTSSYHNISVTMSCWWKHLCQVYR